MDSVSEHNGLALGMLRGDLMGFLTLISHPSNGPFWSNAKAWQSQKETKMVVGKKKKIEKGKKKRNSEGRKKECGMKRSARQRRVSLVIVLRS